MQTNTDSQKQKNRLPVRGGGSGGLFSACLFYLIVLERTIIELPKKYISSSSQHLVYGALANTQERCDLGLRSAFYKLRNMNVTALKPV